MLLCISIIITPLLSSTFLFTMENSILHVNYRYGCSLTWGFISDEWKPVYAGFSFIVYICIAVGDPLIERGMPLFCACTKPGPGFLMTYVVVCLYVQWFKMRGDCSFVGICGNVNITV